MADPGQHVSFEALVALWSRELSESEEAALDAHLFACDACAATSHRLGELVVALREIAPDILSPADVTRMVARGVRIVRNPVDAGARIHVRVTSEADLFVHVLRADLAGARRVDLEFLSPEGVAMARHERVPFDAAAGEVLIACRRHFEGMFPDDVRFRLQVYRGGELEPVGDFEVVHSWG